jgi:hypothetical protein
MTPHYRQVLAVDLCRDVLIKVGKWGDLLAVRLPQSVVDALKVTNSDPIGARSRTRALEAGKTCALTRC